jgi:serine protease Do
MKRFLLMLSCGASLGLPVAAEVDRAAFIKLASSVLKIESLRAQGGYSLGSGVVVGAQQVVTSCHVTRDAREVYVIQAGVRWRVRAQASDLEHDLCVLRVPGLEATPVDVSSAKALRLGQSVNAIGYTGGIGIQNSPGEVLALHRHDGANVIQSSNWFSSGASGGGLFDDDMKLVGVLTFRLRGGTADYYSAPSDWLQPLLKASDREQPVAPLGADPLAFWQRPVETQPLFLRAAVFRRDENWPALRAIADTWMRADRRDPEPWLLTAVAFENQSRWPEARRALECSLALEPDYAPALAELAQLAKRQVTVTASEPPTAPCVPTEP